MIKLESLTKKISMDIKGEFYRRELQRGAKKDHVGGR
jgi:hypothetical protein